MKSCRYLSLYDSPIGRMMISCDDEALCGTWFEGQKYCGERMDSDDPVWKETALIIRTKQWLDDYFIGKDPVMDLPLHFEGTSFQITVWKILQCIPYGTTMSYGELAEKTAKERGLKRISAQACGSAAGHNPFIILVPCHRVVSANGKLSGYAAGIEKKAYLLQLETSWKKD